MPLKYILSSIVACPQNSPSANVSKGDIGNVQYFSALYSISNWGITLVE